MFYYQLYGLTLASEIEFAELIEIPETLQDFTLREAQVPEHLAKPLKTHLMVETIENGFLYRGVHVARFLVKDDTIIFERYPEADGDTISRCFLGPLMGLYLHFKGYLPIHASAVLYDDQALLFSGLSGSGKSTLAAAFLKRGYKVLSDDVTVIRFDGGKAQATSAFPQLRLWHDSITALGDDPDEFKNMSIRVDKKVMPIKQQYAAGSYPIRKLFFLSPQTSGMLASQAVKGIEAFRLLSKNTFRKGFRDLVCKPAQVFQNNSISGHIACEVVSRPAGDPKEVDALVDFILKRV